MSTISKLSTKWKFSEARYWRAVGFKKYLSEVSYKTFTMTRIAEIGEKDMTSFSVCRLNQLI